MSLAQKAEPKPLREGGALPAGVGPLRAHTPIDFRQLARRPGSPAVTLTAVKPATPVAPAPAPAQWALAPSAPADAVHAARIGGLGQVAASVSGSAAALELLAEASMALSVLMTRCHELETALQASRDKAGADLDAAKSVGQRSQQRVEALQGEVTQHEKTIAELKHRLAGSEERAASIQVVVQKSQHAVAEAECLSALFQDKVIAAFGVGSAGHSILQSVRANALPRPA